MSYGQYALLDGSLPYPIIRSPSRYGGIGRSRFFLLSLGLTLAYYLVIGVVIASLFDSAGSGLLNGASGIFLIGAVLVWFAITYVVGLFRLQNQGCKSSGLMMISALVPIINLYLAWRLFACQEGYSDEGRLDRIGKLITVVYLLSMIFLIYSAIA